MVWLMQSVWFVFLGISVARPLADPRPCRLLTLVVLAEVGGVEFRSPFEDLVDSYGELFAGETGSSSTIIFTCNMWSGQA